MFLEVAAAWLVVVVAAIVCGVTYARGQWPVTAGVLFAAASFSAITAPTPLGSVRPEQGALVVLSIALLVTRARDVWALMRAAPLMAVSAVLYLGANVASSLLFAASPLESLKIAGWLALSMAGMVIVAVLVWNRGHDLDLPRWIVGAACIQTLVGLAAVASQAVFNTEWSVQTNDVLLGKTKGLSWEANLLAINVAMALAFVVLPRSIRVSRGLRVLLVAWLGLGLGLAYSRGGLIALAIGVGIVMLALAWTWRHRIASLFRPRLVPIGAMTAMALVIAVGAIQVQSVLGRMGVGVTPDTVIVDAEIGEVPIPTERPGDPVSQPSPSASPRVRYVGTGDTIEVRMRNIRIGLGEIDESPLIGLGTDSFRQRHVEPSCDCGAHIANLPFAAMYDSGVVGLLGLAGLLGSALWAAWRTGSWAYLGALIVMIVGYQITDAFRFASNWIILGAAFGMWLAGTSRTKSKEQDGQADAGNQDQAASR
jgi:hypothetical protein